LKSEDVTPHSLKRTHASLRFALGDDPIYVAAQLGHTEGGFSMRVYTGAVKLRGRLSGEHLRKFDRALERAQMGTNAVSAPTWSPAIGLAEPVERSARMLWKHARRSTS